MKTHDVRATGTVRRDRIRKCPIDDLWGERGDFDFRTCDDIICVSWKDNKTVIVMLNFDSVAPLSSVQRYSRKEKKKISVQCPNLIKRYNKFMGDVDVLDSRIQLYHCKIKGKKRYWLIFIWILESFMANSFLIHRACAENPVDQLQFRRKVVRFLLSRSSTICRPLKRNHSAVRKHAIGSLDKRRRCQVESCTKKCGKGGGIVSYECKFCNLPCHLDCFNVHINT